MATTAIMMATIASQQANYAAMQARKAECAVFIDNYPAKPSVTEMQQYASCVNLVHPAEMTADVVALFLTVIIGFIVLVWLATRI